GARGQVEAAAHDSTNRGVGASASGDAASGGVAAPAGAATPDGTAPPDDGAGLMPHGDHNPHHGGVVYMYDDLHYEVVLDPNGHHRLYFTDEAREDLPAAVAQSVTFVVERPHEQPESLNGAIDKQGESWILDGLPVAAPDTSVRVAFVTKGSSYWIDVPFTLPTP
ncbi:MAG: hypothetical protein AB7J63_19215, partial [Vicinamibacterales bacterium]